MFSGFLVGEFLPIADYLRCIHVGGVGFNGISGTIMILGHCFILGVQVFPGDH